MRLDVFLVENKFFDSRTKARQAIDRKEVFLDGKAVEKASFDVNDDTHKIEIFAEESFVSLGGYKLNKALNDFSYSVNNLVVADIGASTGGFTDCLLQNGAKKVYAIDVGESLLHESLQNDPRIVRMENTNARYLSKKDFEETIDCVTIDVSFISLKLIIPAIFEILSENGTAFLLIKPQFECEKKNIGKSGIVHPSAHPKIVKGIVDFCIETRLYPFGIVNAPIRKGKNIEYVLCVKPSSKNAFTSIQIEEKVKEFVKQNSIGELI